jgi:hypothetical protein
MKFEELKYLWRIVRTVILVLGVSLTFFAFIEISRAYLTLREINSALGLIFLFVVVIGFLWALFSIIKVFATRPKATSYPQITEFNLATKEELKAYCNYLTSYLSQLKGNPYITNDDVQILSAGITRLTAELKSNSSQESLVAAINNTESAVVEPILKKLDDIVDQKNRNALRDIMLYVTFSPYKSLDLFVVIYRNFSMIKNIIMIYNQRPQLRESLLIFRDVIRVVATVNFLNFGSKLLEEVSKGLTKSIPVVNALGHFVDDIVQGFGAGLLTSVAGHAAKYRCRGYKAGDYNNISLNIKRDLKQYAIDVREMLWGDIVREKTRFNIPDVQWEKITEILKSSFDSTIEGISGFVKTSTVTGTKSVMRGVKTSGTAFLSGTKWMYKATSSGVTQSYKHGQRITGKFYEGLKKPFKMIKNNRNKKTVSRSKKKKWSILRKKKGN